MTTKVCIKCGIEKDLDEFHNLKTSKDGHKSTCKECRSSEALKWRLENIEKYREQKRNWCQNNIDKVRDSAKKTYQKNINKKREYQKKYREENKEIVKDRIKKSTLKSKEKYKETSKRWKYNNPEKIKETRKRSYLKNGKEKARRYYNKNKEICIQRSVDYSLKRRKTDSLFKLKHRIGTIILCSLKRKGFTKRSKSMEILGCSYDEFILHLENQFEPWMTWKNYGKYNGELNFGWDIDHIVPTSSGNTEEEIIKLNHYTNLKPLCSKINRDIKKDKVDF